jgi:two-component system, sensor histidine kinase PdtaS
MSRTSHELLLALAVASRISEPDVLRARFLESLSAIDPSRSFEYAVVAPPPFSGLEAFPISTLHSSFGYALMRAGPPAAALSEGSPPDSAEPAILRTAFQFLAVLLENRAQARALEAENTSLEMKVAVDDELIKEQEERYRDIFENHHVVMLVVDPDNGDVVDANPAAAEFYGYERERLLSMKIFDLNVQEREEVSERLALSKSGQARLFTAKHRLSDGSIRDIEVYTGPIVSRGATLLFSILHDVSARLTAEARLQDSLNEKNILLKELNHRVKNNLQIISSLLSLQINSPEGSDVGAELSKAQGRIYTLALLYEMRYRSESFSRMTLSDYLTSIVSAAVDSVRPEFPELRYDIDVEPIELDVDRAAPFGLIVNELVENLVKHASAGPSGGHFSLSVHRMEGGRLRLAAQVDGPPAGPIEEGASPRLGSFRHGGIGLQLVDALVKQLRGEMKVERGEGTRVEVIFPEA